MYFQLEKSDYETIAERIFDSPHDNGTVYLEFGQEEIVIKYEKDIQFDIWHSGPTRDVLTCDLIIHNISHSYFDVEYDEDALCDEFYNIVYKT